MFATFVLRLAKPDEQTELGLDSEGLEDLRDDQLTLKPAAENFLEGARNAWLLGSFFSLLHTITTMIFAHEGSHDLAMEHIAQKTKDLMGFGFGAGIYFNYAFVVLWLADALWWIARPKSYEARANAINWIVYGFMVFIAFNGSVVFASGWIRWVSIAGFAMITWMFIRRSKK